jgi:hypothetical protein
MQSYNSRILLYQKCHFDFCGAADAHDDEDRGKRSKGDAEFRWARPMHDVDQQVSNNNSGNRIEPTTAVVVSRRVLGSFRRVAL